MPQLIATVGGVEIKHVYLAKDLTTLGRRGDNDIVLDNAAVSGRHCVFELRGLADVYVEDAGSTNGTFVNNKRVQRQKLKDEDVVAIASFRVRFLAASEESGFGATSVLQQGPNPQVLPNVHASFRVLTGSSAGLQVPVVKAVSTFGKPGVAVIAVSHRRTGYFAAAVAGEQPPQLNGKPLGPDPILLADQDIIELAGTKMQFVIEA